ncbi:MAG TPA: nucleoside deaminase [Clostridia bacterium]|nr:nucleoside deaminase [Clostridia bacterium]
MAMIEKVIVYEERIPALSEFTETEILLLKRSIEIAAESKDSGNHPFGCLLADAHGNILMEQGNGEITGHGDCTAHPETLLMRYASQRFSKDEMKELTMYSCCEPCAMCTGAMYWGNLGRMIYVCRESELMKVTGDDPRNPTLDLPCRAVIACGQKPLTILGPIIEFEPEFLKLHEGYWNK